MEAKQKSNIKYIFKLWDDILKNKGMCPHGELEVKQIRPWKTTTNCHLLVGGCCIRDCPISRTLHNIARNKTRAIIIPNNNNNKSNNNNTLKEN